MLWETGVGEELLVSFLAFLGARSEVTSEAINKPKCDVYLIWQLGSLNNGARIGNISASAVME